MVGSLRFAAAAAFALLMAGCATAPAPQTTASNDDEYYSSPPPGQPVPHWQRSIIATVETPDKPLQCVPFAREASGINLHGDAGSWWDQAAGKYNRSNSPSLGAVLVLTGYAGPHRGHVAVVTAVESARQIRIDHANWLDDGRIYRNDPVVDVSTDNDWSEVRVWNPKSNTLGIRTYLVRGFIEPTPENSDARVASRD